MSAARRVAAGALGLTLVLGGAAAPASAATSPAPSGVGVTDVTAQDPNAVLSTTVTAARASFKATIAEARSQRRQALVAPKSELAGALAAATTKAQRRLAERAYARAVKPIEAEYASARDAAVTTREAAIEVALATFLEATGRPEIASPLRAYRQATTNARATLGLALQSAKDTYRTDTADERELLVADLEQAETGSDRNSAWRAYLDGCETERHAHQSSVKAARATFYSAMRQAKAVFKADAGISMKKLKKRTFGG